MKKLRVVWDIPEENNPDQWEVQFWIIEDNKPAILIHKVNKNSSNTESLTIPLTT